MHYRRNERNTASPDHVVRIVVHRPSVETGIPMASRNRGQNWEYPYDDMDVGDSFHVMFSETSNPNVASESLCITNDIQIHDLRVESKQMKMVKN